MSERFERHARTVSLVTLISRFTGLARDASLSRVFGAGGVTSAFFFAFMIPNLFRRLFGEGALAAAFLTTYSQLNRDDPKTARSLASVTVSLLVLTLGAIVLLGEVGLYFISRHADHTNLAVWLTMVMLSYMPMICIVAILGAMLQVHGRFGPTAAAPIVLNLCLITSTVGVSFLVEGDVASPDYERHRVIHIGCVSASVILAGALQVTWSLLALRKWRWWVSDFKAAAEPMNRVIRQALPMILGLSVLQLNTLFDGLIASYPVAVGPTVFGIDYPLTEGANAAVGFAQRLQQFPVGVFGVAIATAIFPALALQATNADRFADTVRRGLRLVVFLGLPASAGLVLVREPLAAVILQGGDFTASDTKRVGFVLLGYAPAIWAYSMTHVLTRAFYARGESLTPVKVAVGMVSLNLILNCTLIWTPLREAGLAWSTAICAVLQVVLLMMLLRRRLGGIIDKVVLAGWARSAIVTCAMILTVLAVGSLDVGDAETWSGSLWILATMVGTGGAVFGACAMTLKMPELSWALGRKERTK